MTGTELLDFLLDCLPPDYEFHQVPDGSVQVVTTLLYPDGGVADVFVLERGEGYFVTDHGDTLGWVRMQSAGDPLSRAQRRSLEDVCLSLGVDIHQGQLCVHCDNAASLGDAVQRVAKGIERVAKVLYGPEP